MRKLRNIFGNNHGFTLIELLVVIAVLGILASISVPRLTGVIEKARLSEAEATLGTLKNAMELYYIENGTYNASGVSFSITTVAGIDSSHPIFSYLDKDSLPTGWKYAIPTADVNTYTIYMVGNGGDIPTKLGAKFVKGTGLKTNQDVNNSDPTGW